MAKKKTEIRVKQFKDGSNNWWCGFLHMGIENGKIKTYAGGIQTDEHTDIMTKYLKRKKLL